MKTKLPKVAVAVFLGVMIIFPTLSFADTEQPIKEGEMRIENPLGSDTDTINGLIKRILEGVLKIGIPVIALAIIYSGFLFVSAQGNSEKPETAKKSFTYTLIGAAILLGAWALAQVISETVLAL